MRVASMKDDFGRDPTAGKGLPVYSRCRGERGLGGGAQWRVEASGAIWLVDGGRRGHGNGTRKKMLGTRNSFAKQGRAGTITKAEAVEPIGAFRVRD